jgi:hypothetical protein
VCLLRGMDCVLNFFKISTVLRKYFASVGIIKCVFDTIYARFKHEE